jgi:hypothetical protein
MSRATILRLAFVLCLCFSPGCTRTLNDWFAPERLDRIESLEEMERQNREYDERRKLDPSLPPRRHGGLI